MFCCWVVGLLDCGVAGLLGCWVVSSKPNPPDLPNPSDPSNPQILAPSRQPSIQSGTAECAERLNPPHLGQRLESHSYLSVPGRVSLPYPPAGRAHSVGRPSLSALSASSAPFFNLFFCPNFGRTSERPKIPLFREICRFLVAPTSIFDHFGSQNRSPRPTFSVFFQKR